MTPECDEDVADRVERLRAELAAIPGDSTFYVQVTEAQALDLASGYVPAAVQAMVLTMLDFRRIDQQRALRPVQGRR